MTGQEFKLIFKENKVYLNPDKPLTLEQVGLYKREKSLMPPAFWIIRVINYREIERKIFCEILSYNVGETDYPFNQKTFAEKLKQIEAVSFRGIDTGGLYRTLGLTPEISLPPIKEIKVINQVSLDQTIEDIPPQHITTVFKDSFFIPLKSVQFKLGKVSFNRQLKFYSKSIEINIVNYDIREEFDAIKNYFSNVLNTKKIEVNLIIEFNNNQIASVDAKSPEIDKINKELIDQIKFEFLRSIKKKVLVNVNKNIFTMEEYFETYGEDKLKSNLFYREDKELFDDLLRITNSKHYKNLRFLSSKHDHRIMKLRFIHKPFSFIFLIAGERNYHFIWETLDTEEATYIWHVDNNLEALKVGLRKIEDIINIIKVQGKNAYISSNKDHFKRIYHDYSDFVDGFIKWKGELESILT